MLVVEVAVARNVLQPLGEAQTQPAAGVDLAREDLADCVARRVAQIPRVYDRGDLIRPRHRNARPALRDNDRARVRGRDLTHKLVRTSGQRERRTVVSLRLPVPVQAHDGDDGIRLLGELDRASHKVVGVLDLRAAQTDTRTYVHDRLDGVVLCRRADVHEIDENLVSNPRFEKKHGMFLYRAAVEEIVTAGLFRPVVDHELSVDVELGTARRKEAELEVSVLVARLQISVEAESEAFCKFFGVVDTIRSN